MTATGGLGGDGEERDDRTGEYSGYQREIYVGGAPPFTTSLQHLAALAKEKLASGPFNYVWGSAGQRHTDDNNIAAFKRWRLVPRMLRDANKRDMSTRLFGKRFDSPVIVAPVGVCGLWHEEGEEAVARAAEAVGVPFCMSTAATRSIETVAEANGDGTRFYQLYWPLSDDITVSLLQRAKKNGFTALIVTLDTVLLGHRPADLDDAYLPFLKGEGCQVGFSDPVFCERMEAKPTHRLEDIESDEERQRLALGWLGEINSGTFRTWDDLKVIRDNWDGPIILKGIQSIKDAHMAIQLKFDAIGVSNHGGRQLDGARASLDALAEIGRDPIVKKSGIDIIFDSGIRGGADVIKALALGANAVMLGRPWVYGLALGGQEGVEHVLKTVMSEVETSMALMGCPTVDLLREQGHDWLELEHEPIHAARSRL